MKRRIIRGLAILVVLDLVFTGVVYSMMRSTPATFNQFMAKLPMPAMMLFPFETLWFQARGGVLQPGEMAPDFDLRVLHSENRVRLSAERGKRPVLLVFGSYT